MVAFGQHNVMPTMAGYTFSNLIDGWYDADGNSHNHFTETGDYESPGYQAFVIGMHSFCPILEIEEMYDDPDDLLEIMPFFYDHESPMRRLL